jgi:hypothetical protein
MRAIAATLIFCVAAFSIAQSDKIPDLKLHKQTHDSINRKLVSGFKTPKTTTSTSTSGQSKSSDTATHPGKHREHRYYPGHAAKDGHYIPEHWQWVWVNDK